ncbi:MAG: hypothetical protein O3C20_22325, partial [Verrucomicrobia bacterium]|nr:hypothetical protein [Verrucomicrobiota bacterium]
MRKTSYVISFLRSTESEEPLLAAPNMKYEHRPDSAALTLAGRLMGAMDHLGLNQFKKDFEHILQSNGYPNLNEENPFDQPPLLALSERVKSPHVARMKTMWMQMREGVIKHFPKSR